MNKHTPGPWETTIGPTSTDYAVCLPDGGDIIAEVYAPMGAAEGEIEANLALIAAAPDLLQAATNLLSYLPESGDPFQDKLEAALVAAIAKAEQA